MATIGIPNGNHLEPESSIGKVRLGKVSLGYSLEFEELWNVYPEKIGKGKAYEAWKKLSSSEMMLCVPAIKNQVDNKHFRNNRGEDYIPHPTTWLNQKRWDDEVKEIKNNSIDLRTKK